MDRNQRGQVICFALWIDFGCTKNKTQVQVSKL